MRRLLAICCAVIFLDATFFAALAPLLPELRTEFGLSEAGAGLLTGSYAAGVLICAIPAGWFAARHSPRGAVLLGLVGMGVFSPIFGFAEAALLLDSARFFQGASGALLWAGSMSWVIVAGPDERRGALVGMLVAAATVGELLGAPIGALAHIVGREIVFAAVGVVSAILFVVASGTPSARIARPQAIGTAWRRLAGSGVPTAMWLLGVAAFAFGVATVIAPLRLDELGGTALLIAAAFACASVVETIIGPQVGKLSDRIGRSRPYVAGTVFGSVAVLAISLFEQEALVFASVVLFAVAAGLAFTPSIAATADSAEDAGIDQGYASGLSNVAWGGGHMLGAAGGGALAATGYLLPAVITVAVLASGAAMARR